MDGIRIVELPGCKMASSGCGTGPDQWADDGLLRRFNVWWSTLDKKRADKFFPRDFMWYDREKDGLVWYYAIPEDITDTAGFEIVDFAGGLYAVAVYKDDDDDGYRVYDGVKDWIKSSSSTSAQVTTICFTLSRLPLCLRRWVIANRTSMCQSS